jgi:hypothetical protein
VRSTALTENESAVGANTSGAPLSDDGPGGNSSVNDGALVTLAADVSDEMDEGDVTALLSAKVACVPPLLSVEVANGEVVVGNIEEGLSDVFIPVLLGAVGNTSPVFDRSLHAPTLNNHVVPTTRRFQVATELRRNTMRKGFTGWPPSHSDCPFLAGAADRDAAFVEMFTYRRQWSRGTRAITHVRPGARFATDNQHPRGGSEPQRDG